ncbi:hypothetical protein J6590_061748 [Homalodisca vitripennis]|nr:hypothetical protein J6590_061748 [Homalodisca vitripennis]
MSEQDDSDLSSESSADCPAVLSRDWCQVRLTTIVTVMKSPNLAMGLPGQPCTTFLAALTSF